jgi:hypothetical protein
MHRSRSIRVPTALAVLLVAPACSSFEPAGRNPAERTAVAPLVAPASATSWLGATAATVALYETRMEDGPRLALVVDRGAGERSLVVYLPATFEAAPQARRIVFRAEDPEVAFELPSAERVRALAADVTFAGYRLAFDLAAGGRRVIEFDLDRGDDGEGSVVVSCAEYTARNALGLRAATSESAVELRIVEAQGGEQVELWTARPRPALATPTDVAATE